MTDLSRRLETAATALARAEGRRDALAARAAVLEDAIALAKARLEQRQPVEALIQEIQAEVSRRNLSSFETLLTALVQEVLPGEKPVSLDLTAERGLAALDIGVLRPDGAREDVLEDNGGALTNVIGMALRLIAVVKAGAGRFLALDEADCWIAPERVPAFYRVLEDSAERLGVQCLVISHHDVAAFSGRLRVARIVGEPASGVTVAGPDPAGDWGDGQPGFRFIRLVDVQGYRDATLALGPGVNALIGPNNRGKSTFIRALRAVFYAEARDSLVRAGEPAATVEIGLSGGRTLRFSRQPRRTPVNLWSLHGADSAIVEADGFRHETGGRATPAWVEALFGIVKVEDLDVHIAHQKFPVFLLGETPARRSAVLSIGQEAAYLRDMLAIHRERCTRDQALVRNGEKELIGIRATLAALADVLPALAARVAQARTRADGIRAGEAAVAGLQRQAQDLRAGAEGLARARARAARLAGLPADGDVTALAGRLMEARERARIGAAVLSARGALARAQDRAGVLAALPDAAPALADGAGARTALERIRRLEAERARSQAAAAEAGAGLAAVEADIAALVTATGGRCPACGQAVEPGSLLHDHGRAAA